MESKPLLSLAEKIEPEHSAVIVIDMQNDFCSPEGAVSGRRDWRRVQAIIPTLRDFLDKARDRQVRVIFVQATHEEEEFSGPERELMIRKGRKDFACKRGSWGAEFDNNLQPRDTDAIVGKKKYSAFVGTELDSLLKGWGISTLIVTGVSTCTCVESTARDGFMRDYYIIMPRDLTANYEENLYQATLTNIDERFGQVVSSEEVLAIWQGVKTA
jgi:ureidoacrylate peracid hydrolase